VLTVLSKVTATEVAVAQEVEVLLLVVVLLLIVVLLLAVVVAAVEVDFELLDPVDILIFA
jgi:hypothetical protein